uniref:ABC transporter substrate-binding protein n=1 Tax=Nocardia donostiensis TaxID=1538463 RepID=UPI001C3863BF|nr:ABC transporter substrate-binding protein [Nocardia donostiensis]
MEVSNLGRGVGADGPAFGNVAAGHEALTIGVVVARTGRLASLGDPVDFAMSYLAPSLEGISIRGHRIRLVSRDSTSTAEGGRRAVAELVRDEGAVVVLTLAGTQVLPAVADSCEELGVTCISSTFPWQVYYYGRGATDNRPFERTFHFCWGLDDIAEIFADLWEHTCGTSHVVGCLWNGGPQGNWSRDDRRGFAPVARDRGYRLVDPEGYHEPAATLDTHLNAFREADADIVTSAATARDLGLFRAHATEVGWRPRLITCSRWLAYPPCAAGPDGPPAQANVGTLVYWSPAHPYWSSLDGSTAAEYAEAYEQWSGRQWLQPLGLAHALFEVTVHALRTADDPADTASIAAAMKRTNVHTLAGRLDWTSGPVPNIATVPLAGGQWQPGVRHDYELAVITPGRVDGLRPTADLSLSTA